MKLKNVHLDQSGLRMFVGSIDAVVLAILWEANKALSIRAIHAQCNDRWHYNTIATIVYRLVKAGILHKQGKQPIYWPIKFDENSFIDHCVLLVTEKLRNEYPDTFNEVVLGYQKVIKQ